MSLLGRIVFSSGIQLDCDIWSLDLALGELTRLTRGENINSYPRWSPDGKWIAYISIGEDLVPSLWLMNSRGTDHRRLTRAIYCHGPNWSPDGKRIIFSGNGDVASEIDVCTISPDGTDLTRICGIPGLETSPSFSPNGQHILFSAPVRDENGILPLGRRDILEYNLAEGTLRTLCSHPARDDSPVYSPDGGTIAFISQRGDTKEENIQQSLLDYRRAVLHGPNAAGREAMKKLKRKASDGDIFLVCRDGTKLRRLVTDAFYTSGVCWSPCGQYLAYSSSPSGDPGARRLLIVDSQSGKTVDFSYDRTQLENSIEPARVAKLSPLMNLVPHFIARHFLPKDLWGAEQTPHWSR